MEEDLELDLGGQPQINRTEQRINSLTSKLGEAGKEREEALQKAEEAEKRAVEAEKKAEFISTFSEVSTKYQGATEYKDKIQEKVALGYSVEDATVSVLNAEGKLLPQAEIEAPQQQVAGGSAPINLPNASATPGEMTQTERRAELLNPERAADIERILRQGF